MAWYREKLFDDMQENSLNSLRAWLCFGWYFFQAMEAAGVMTIYDRTPEGIRYMYIPFVGDGAFKAYSQVAKAAPYWSAVYIYT